jgi:hypothetical protein
MAAVIEFTFSGAVHTQTLYLCAGSLVVRGRYCIIIGSCCILTAKDNNVDLSCNIIISNNGSGCQIVVIIATSDPGEIASISVKTVYTLKRQIVRTFRIMT